MAVSLNNFRNSYKAALRKKEQLFCYIPDPRTSKHCLPDGMARIFCYRLMLRRQDSNPHHVSRVAPTRDLYQLTNCAAARKYSFQKTAFLCESILFSIQCSSFRCELKHCSGLAKNLIVPSSSIISYDRNW